MTLHTTETETAPNPIASIIVLHGLGDQGSSFVPFAHELDLASVGPIRFVFPDAPVQPVTINGGHAMRSWYDIRDASFSQREDADGLRASQAEVEALIAREVARGVPARRIVLAGFSQGCAMTLLTGLRHGARLAGLAGLSGYLPLAGETAAERSDVNKDVPIFLAHGRADPVVPFARATASRDALLKLGCAVEWHEYPMPHTICAQELGDLNRFLARVLAPD